MGRKSEKVDAAERLPVVDLRGTPLGAEIDRVLDASRVEGEAMRAEFGSPEVEVDEDLAETIERVEEEIDARIEKFELERKVSKYEGYFGAALSGVVAYFGAEEEQYAVLVEMSHELAMKCLETAPGRREYVLARIEAWGMMEEV